VLPGGPIPQASAAQLQERARAKQAAQSEVRVSSDIPDIRNIVQERRGPLLAGQQARQIDFEAVDKQRQNVQNIVNRQNQYHSQKSVRAAHQEMEQLGNTLGSAYKELHPLQRDAIEARAEQLRSLVRSQDPDKVLEAGRRKQLYYMKERNLQASRAREREAHRERMRQATQSESGTGPTGVIPEHVRAGRGTLSEGGIERHHGAGFLEVR